MHQLNQAFQRLSQLDSAQDLQINIVREHKYTQPALKQLSIT